ncbi:MAG TPA: RloB family protein [Pyrinomonadaceae bacterium]|nr:RloB family protein [Pyrinomonadaceae bacterium]
MAKNRFSRPRKPKQIGAKVIIVCEGVTEEIYFEAIRKSKRLQTIQITVVNPAFTDPENIVKTAVEIRKDLRKEKRWAEEDQIWAVYDGDEHKDKDLRNWQSALDLAAREDVNLGISNPSFELWYLLHYKDQNAEINRHETYKKLRKEVSVYHKTEDLYISHFQPRTDAASARAIMIADRIERDFLDKFSNPSTEIYLLVKRLLELSQ